MDGDAAPETEVPRAEDEGSQPGADESSQTPQPKGGKKKRIWQKVNSLYNPAPYAAQKGASKGGKGGKSGKGSDGESGSKGKGKGKDMSSMYGESEPAKSQEEGGKGLANGDMGAMDGEGLGGGKGGGPRSKKQGGKGGREGKGGGPGGGKGGAGPAGGKAGLAGPGLGPGPGPGGVGPGRKGCGCGALGAGPGGPGSGPGGLGPGAGVGAPLGGPCAGLGPGLASPGGKGGQGPLGGLGRPGAQAAQPSQGEPQEQGAEASEGPRPSGPQRTPLSGKGGVGQGGVAGVPVAMGAYGYGAAVPYPCGAMPYPYNGPVPAMYAMPYYVMPSPTPLNTGSSPYMPGGGGPQQPQVNSADRQNLKSQVQSQIEYYFGEENMIKDEYLRSRLMNEEGWVQIAPLANFRRIQQMTTDMSIILDAIASSQKLEMDAQGQHVRLKNNWQKWVWRSKPAAPAPGA